MKRRWHALEARWPWLAVVSATQGRFGELQGGYLAGAITLAAFLSIFPLILVAVAVLGFFSLGHPDVSSRMLDVLAIPSHGDAARTVHEAIDTAEQSRRAASVIGVAGLLWSGLGLVAALQYAYDSVWQVNGRGWRDKGVGLLWLVGAAVLFVASFAATAAVQFLPGFLAPLEILVALAIGTVLFLWADKLLPNREIGWRPLLPGAVVIDRNVLEWRLDPTSDHRIAQVTGADQVIVLVCNEGYASSLAAATLRRLGLRRATDLVGGYQAWLALDRVTAG